MTEKKNDHNLDPERMEQNHDDGSSDDKDFNAGGNASDYDGGHPKDTEPESEGRIKNGEEYARRQEGVDEIDNDSYNSGGNASDYDGGHPEDSSGNSEGKVDSDKK